MNARNHKNKVCFGTESKAKRATTDVTHNYLCEGYNVEIYQEWKQTYTKPNTVRKGTDNNNREHPPRTEQNISNKINITQIDKGRKSLTQDKTCYGCIPQNKKLTNAQRRYIYYSSKV